MATDEDILNALTRYCAVRTASYAQNFDMAFMLSKTYFFRDVMFSKPDKPPMIPAEILRGKHVSEVFPMPTKDIILVGLDTAQRIGIHTFRYDLMGEPWEAKVVARHDDILVYVLSLKDSIPLRASLGLPPTVTTPTQATDAIRKRKLSEAGTPPFKRPQSAIELSRRPLRFLFVDSQPLLHEGNVAESLDQCSEKEFIRRALALSNVAVDFRIVLEATAPKLAIALAQQWDVVHISAHGHTDGSLLLEDGTGKSHALDGPNGLVELFRNAKNAAPVVVLSSCYSIALAEALLANPDTGVRAVVACKNAVNANSSTILSEQLYGMLAKGETIGSAFQSAQRAVATSPLVGDSVFACERKWHIADDELITWQEPWSQRFVLMGDGSLVLSVSHGEITVEHVPKRPLCENNLPPMCPQFLGRNKEMANVIELLMRDTTRGVCISGPAGIGKTELTKAVAAWLSNRGHFEIVFWDSACAQNEDTMHAPYCHCERDALRMNDLLINFQNIAAKNVPALVIADRWDAMATKLTQYRENLMRFIAWTAPHIKWLINSRARPPAGDYPNLCHYELGRLQAVDARKLFWNTLGNANFFRDRQTFSPRETVILRKIGGEILGGYPLAVVVAASTARTLTLEEILSNYATQPRKLLDSIHDVTRKSWGLWPALTEAYTTLNGATLELFLACSVLPSPFTMEDVAAISRRPLMSVEQAVEQLANISLIVKHPTHLEMHNVISQFGLVQLCDQQDYSVVTLAIRTAAHLINSGADSCVLAAGTVLHRVLPLVGTDTEIKVLGELFFALFEALSAVTDTQPVSEQYSQATDMAIEVATLMRNDMYKACAVVARSVLKMRCTSMEECCNELQEACSAMALTGDPEEIVRSLNRLSAAQLAGGSYDAAMAMLEEAAQWATRTNYMASARACVEVAITQSLQGQVLVEQGNKGEAMNKFQASVAMFELSGRLFSLPSWHSHVQLNGETGVPTCNCGDVTEHFEKGEFTTAQSKLLRSFFDRQHHQAVAASCLQQLF
eukprot:TRINITY_DN9354_c0_g1_i1.p1 TRINITY_DN9354_c0_g1~~TRINITY_DN9354_c0_g1_i1.p1  ORF type:complete len:1020 (+),score=215.26 TRINITY_DN9354_c0_g1_i1:107-3166(+)